MKLNEEAINEINHLLNEVKEVVQLLADWGIHITSDPWTATSFCDKEDILSWNKKDFEEINIISTGDIFYIGGNITTGHEHEYKNTIIPAPKQLAKVESEIFEEYLKSIVKTISLKHFELNFEDRFGLTYNCGWEHYLCISATIKESGLEKNTLCLIEEIMKEEDNIIELSASPLYKNPENNFNKESQLIPEGDFEFMVEFFSDLIIDEDYIYQGVYGLNSQYIKDAMKLINEVENRADEIANKFADKGVKVTVNGLNDGCEKGMAIYVWIPHQ